MFATNGNATTRENIANVFSAKMLLSLLPLNLKVSLQPSGFGIQTAQNLSNQDDESSREAELLGHISRPVVGEGRQTPDRQMFFVNSRPCALPQVAKAVNEVYKSYNVTQSPFVFANLKMDTNSYDVNVSPDKRTIMLHDQAALLEALKNALTELFEDHEQSVPQAQLVNKKLPSYKALSVDRTANRYVEDESPRTTTRGLQFSNTSFDASTMDSGPTEPPASLIRKFAGRNTEDREDVPISRDSETASKEKQRLARKVGQAQQEISVDESPGETITEISQQTPLSNVVPRAVQDFNRLIEAGSASATSRRTSTASATPDHTPARQSESHDRAEVDSRIEEEPIPSTKPSPASKTPSVVQNAFDRMRPQRMTPETATITIGNTTTKVTLGIPPKRRRIHTPKFHTDGRPLAEPDPILIRSLRSFAAAGSQMDVEMDDIETPSLREMAARSMEHRTSPINSSSLPQTQLTPDADVGEETKPDEEMVSVEGSDIGEESDDEYLDEDEKRRREEAKVAKMIAAAENAAARPTEDNLKRAVSVLKSRSRKDATLQLLKNIDVTVDSIANHVSALQDRVRRAADDDIEPPLPANITDEQFIEERLALTVSKSDFARMKILGQFNLGFILALRPKLPATSPPSTLHPSGRQSDELFIIDQHASDEKYNFETLQSTTSVQTQRLVHPKPLDLTAVDEELILQHTAALAKNGFTILTDVSGAKPVGRRCSLASLPLSKEVVFGVADLEELLALLGEHVGGAVPRPSKVRRMFAMRACRKSIMVGRTLTQAQMEKVVRHMGEIDKPWNCPHGRPTMRHLYGLGEWEGWREGDGVLGMGEEVEKRDWGAWAAEMKDREDRGGDGMEFEEDDGEDPGEWLFRQQ